MNEEEALFKACLEDFSLVPFYSDWLKDNGHEVRGRKLLARWKNWRTWRGKARAVVRDPEYHYLSLADQMFWWGVVDSPEDALEKFAADYEAGEDVCFRRYLEKFFHNPKKYG